MGNRKKAEEFILKYIKKFTKNEENVKLYKDLFKRLSDKEFEELMDKIEKGDYYLQVIVPHDEEYSKKIRLEDNFKLAKELGYDFFQHLFIGPINENIPKVKTPHKLYHLLLPFRRMKQTIDKGVSVAEHDRKIDLATGQVVDESRSSRLSYPELQILLGMGLKDTVIELTRDRGGDLAAAKVLKNALMKFGEVSEELVSKYAQGALSNRTLKVYFNSMHIKINVLEKNKNFKPQSSNTTLATGNKPANKTSDNDTGLY